jgi:hypothetical protein
MITFRECPHRPQMPMAMARVHHRQHHHSINIRTTQERHHQLLLNIRPMIHEQHRPPLHIITATTPGRSRQLPRNTWRMPHEHLHPPPPSLGLRVQLSVWSRHHHRRHLRTDMLHDKNRLICATDTPSMALDMVRTGHLNHTRLQDTTQMRLIDLEAFQETTHTHPIRMQHKPTQEWIPRRLVSAGISRQGVVR